MTMREVVLFTTVVAVAAMGTRDMSPGGALDTAASPVNNTDFLRMSEEHFLFDYWNSMAERKGCSATISCIRAGGHCVKSHKACEGEIDPRGCKGRKCKCCIPDHTTPEPPTCPACTCAPCPTKEGTTSCTPGTTATTTATAKTTPTIESRCAAIDGFLMSTQCFKYYNDQKRKWTEAQTMCQENGLELAEPHDEVAVTLRQYLVDNYGDDWVWLGARVSGSQMRWVSTGEEIMSSNALWWPGGYSSSSDFCMVLLINDGYMQLEPTRPYYAYPCKYHLFALCEVVME